MTTTSLAASETSLISSERLETRVLGVTFTTNDDPSFVALHDVNVSIKNEEFVALIGPSGCGKSTLLNVLGGLLRPTSGIALADGIEIRRIPDQIGYMFQKATLLPWMSIRKNVGLPLSIRKEKNPSLVEEIIDLVGLEGFHDAFPSQLSGGMRTRAELARLLIQDPEILLMDEPFGALDAQTRVLMQEEFLRHWSEKKRTVVMVTHDLHEALLMADRIVLMGTRPGRILREFEVGIGRPRLHDDIVNEERYRELYSEIWSLLREQTVRDS